MRAFGLFFLAFAISVYLILNELGEPWAPSLPVLGYGLLLFYAQLRYYVDLNATVKDAPYFLGFILTLIALLKVLSGIRPGVTTDPTFLTQHVGAAILTTVAGLFVRQLLLSRDPAEEGRDAVFQSLAKEIKERTVDFYQSQKQFVALVQEFVATREGLFSQEEKAFTRYVERMQAAGTILGRLESEHVERFDKVLTAFDSASTAFARAGSEGATKLLHVRQEIEAQLKQEGESHRRAVASGAEALAASRSALEAELGALNGVLAGALPLVSEQVKALAAQVAVYPGAVAGLHESVQSLSQEVLAIRDSIATVGADLKALSSGLGALPDELGGRLRSISADLKGIDAIVDDLVQLLNKRIATAG